MLRAERLRARAGAALIFSLLMLLALDCVVLGTLYLALLERRAADNVTAALRLRLAAESGARVALARWTPALDSLAPGAAPIIAATGTTDEGYHWTTQLQRVSNGIYTVRGEASEVVGAGRAAVLLLVQPPAFAARLHFHAAAASIPGPITLAGAVRAAASASCLAQSSIAIRVTALENVTFTGTGNAEGEVAYLPADADATAHVPTAIDRIGVGDFALYALRTVSGDYRLDTASTGVLIVHGDLTIAAGVSFNGLLLVSGTLTIEPDAHVTGAIHAGSAHIAGTVTLDACAVTAAATRARLTKPRLPPGRAWLPAF